MNGEISYKDRVKYPKHGGFCLETQFFPNAPTRLGFPPRFLPPEEYLHHHLPIFGDGLVLNTSYCAYITVQEKADLGGPPP